MIQRTKNTSLKKKQFSALNCIGDDIYSTVDACKTANEMWIAIERLQQDFLTSLHIVFSDQKPPFKPLLIVYRAVSSIRGLLTMPFQPYILASVVEMAKSGLLLSSKTKM
ncbi:hypothetical protein Tco_0703292 [Tanacetum coccineum]|uniref:Uncharacterized protein n=1 Tax=Tanacetum coccineum TaxID=301880 RepID=A0ABQ4XYX3_9ASTR